MSVEFILDVRQTDIHTQLCVIKCAVNECRMYTRRDTDINTHLLVKCAANECRMYTRRKTDRHTYTFMC